MHFQFFAALIGATAFLGAQAQSVTSGASIPTSTSSISPCVLGCTTGAASAAGCGSVTNITCVCTSMQFQAAAGACLQANCTAADASQGIALQGSLCPSGGNSTALATASSGANGTASAATSTAASSGVSPSATHSGVGALEVNVVMLTGILAGAVVGIGALL